MLWSDEVDRVAEVVRAEKKEDTVIVLVLGATDTGKSTFVAELAATLAKEHQTAVVDTDVGQSHIGPPTCVGWAVCKKGRKLEQVRPAGLGFVVDVTPVRHLLQFTAAVATCCEQARQKADVVIIDTPGFVRGPAAGALWWSVQHIIGAGHIVTLERSAELSDIVAGFAGLRINIQRVQVPEQVPVKTAAERQTYRLQQFEAYLKRARSYDINLGKTPVQWSGGGRRDELTGRAVGWRDAKGQDIAMGVVTGQSRTGRTVKVKIGRSPRRKNGCLIFGEKLRDLEGRWAKNG